MKKIVIAVIIVILVGLGGLYFFKSRNQVENPNTNNTGQTGTTGRDPSNATFTIEDETVTLSQGKGENSPAPGSAIVEETVLMDKFAYGDINGDSKEDTALLLVRYGGGSGTFIYVAGYISGPVNYKGTNAVFVGDRVAPQSISISNGTITVVYLDRGPDDSFADEPTIRTTKTFVYKNGSLEEK